MWNHEMKGGLWAAFALLALGGVLGLSTLVQVFSWDSFRGDLFGLDLGLSLVFSARFIFGAPLLVEHQKWVVVLSAIAALPIYAVLETLGVDPSVAQRFFYLRLLALPLLYSSLGLRGHPLSLRTLGRGYFLLLLSLITLHTLSCFWIDPMSTGTDFERYRQAFLSVLPSFAGFALGAFLLTKMLKVVQDKKSSKNTAGSEGSPQKRKAA